MMKPEIDAEFASLIPPLSEDEYNQLEANLLAEGCRDRLLVWGDILIDGHNRLQICTKHNIPYEVAAYDFADRDEAIRYIILNQFGRRNLSLGDRSLLALKLGPIYKAKAKSNQQQSPGRGKKGLQNSANLFPVDTRKKIAEIAGVSHDTIEKVRKIVDKGTPEQLKRIKEGGKGNSVSAVYDEVRKTAAPVSDVPTENSGEDNSLPKTAVSESDAPAENRGEDDSQPKMDGGGDGQETPDDFPETGGKEDDLERIRGYVADLKNPGLDRSFTTEMFVAEYEAFAERFIRSIGAFAFEPYKETCPLLSDAERKKMTALGGSMIKAIEKQNSITKE